MVKQKLSKNTNSYSWQTRFHPNMVKQKPASDGVTISTSVRFHPNMVKQKLTTTPDDSSAVFQFPSQYG